jgi:hypothetical protein
VVEGLDSCRVYTLESTRGCQSIALKIIEARLAVCPGKDDESETALVRRSVWIEGHSRKFLVERGSKLDMLGVSVSESLPPVVLAPDAASRHGVRCGAESALSSIRWNVRARESTHHSEK